MATLVGLNVPLNEIGTFIASLLIAVGFGLNLALHRFCLDDFAEQCYLFAKEVSPFLRSVLYYLLTSLGCIVFVVISFLVEPDVTGVEVALEADTFNLLIVFGWVVYAEESRQTTLEGFLVVRDCLFYGGTIAIMAYCTSLEAIQLWWWGVLPGLFLVYWLMNYLNSSIQYRIMKLLNLLQDERVVSPQLLLTQQSTRVDINELEDIITDNQAKVDEEIEKFRVLLERAVVNERQRKIHENFAKMVLTFKTAIEIKRSTEARDRSQIYQKFWLPKQEEYFGGPTLQEPARICEEEEQPVLEQQPVEQKQITPAPIESDVISSTLKYLYFPVYLLSLAKGRLKYLCYLLGLALLFGTMLLIHLSCAYLRLRSVNYQTVGLLVGQLLAMPKLLYFLQLAGHSDYDFCNIFLQNGIVKVCLILPLGFLLNSITAVQLDRSRLSRYLIIKGATVGAFLLVLSLKKIVARQENFKYLGGLYLLGLVGCTISWFL